ncbi:MAG: sugar phosphate isomerase/epimerase family protein [Acidimicrobiia bacterium]
MPTIGLAPGTGFEIHTLADLDTYLGAVADAGFDAVSLALTQLAGDPVGAARLLTTHGLRCTDVLSMRVTRDDDETMASARAMAPAVDALGADHVLAMFWTRLSDESLDRLGRCADVAGAPIALEFGPGGAADTVASADRFVDALGIDRVSVLADTFHFFRGDSTWSMLESVPLDHLPIVQFTDALPALSDDYMAETTNRRAWGGHGELELGRFASTLLDRGWDGVVSVEVISAELRQLPVAEFARLAYATTAPYWT